MRLVPSSLRRVARIARVVARHGLAHALGPRADSLPPGLGRRLRRWLPMLGRPAPERLRMLFEDVGGTFVKFGQMLALQPDILTLEYCDALFNLLDRVEPFCFAEVERIVFEELGRKPGELFDDFDPEPLATASVGQVHVARLGGQKVAVKVQRPNVENEFANDVRLMVTTVRVIRTLRLKPLYFMIEPVQEFVEWTREELDYRVEARYGEQLRHNGRDNPVQVVPRIFAEYTTRRVLVAEFLEGVTLLDYLRARERGDEVLLRRLEKRGFDRTRFAGNVIDNFLGDCFRHGLYHADLHPANLMILDDSVVGYVDFGITGAMSPFSRRHLVAMTLALALGDTENLVGEFLRLSAVGPDSDPETLRRRLLELLGTWYEERDGERRLRVSFTRVCQDFLAVSRETGVLPERDIIKYIRSAIVVDGLCSRFEPEFHIGQRLAAECASQIRWQGLGDAVSQERLLAGLGMGQRLLLGGPQRVLAAFDRLSRGELPVRAEVVGPSGGGERAGEVLPLGAMVLVLAVLLTRWAETPAFGLNLFTAEVLLLVAALARLLAALYRPARSGVGDA